MSQPTYFEFVAEPAPTIKALQQVTNESLGQAQPEMDNCVREYFRWRLPELLRNYEVQKTIDPRINVKRGYKIGAPIEGMSQTFFISTYLRSFVRIPLTAIKDPVRCDPILNELIGCFDEQSMVDDLQNVVSQLQTLPDAYDHIDAAPYLFADFSTLASLQSLRTTPGPREPSAEALSYGYFQSSYHNLMAEGGLPSPAEMLIERLRAVSTWGVKLRSQFYANFACLVQGSGSGKSRLAKECSAHFYVVYLCLRPASSSGSPPRSALATLFLHIAEEAAVTQEAHRLLIDRFFAAIFYVIATQVDWEAHSTDGRVSPSTFWEYTMVEQAASFSQKVARTFREWQTHPTLQHESVATLMEQALTVLDPQSAISGSTFLVVLDEARELLCSCRNVPNTPSLFLQWRSWLSFSGTWSSSFFLLLDTTSRVTNFFPSKPTEDPSARIAQHGVKLLRPIFEFPFLGPWPLPSELQTFLQRSLSSTVVPPSAWSTTGQYQPLVDVFRFSRPMYLYVRPTAALTEKTPIDDLMGEVLSLTQRKLFTTDLECKNINTVAVCYRYGLRPYQLALQDTLLGSHSATLTAMFPDGSLDVRYLPEPMVGEALSRWLPATCQHMTPRLALQMKLKTLLEHLRSELRSRQLIRSLSKGDRGELATSVHLLHAYEEATRQATEATAAMARQICATAAATETRGVYQTFSGLLRVQDWVSALAGLPLSAAFELFEEGAAPGSPSDRLTCVLASAVSFTGWTVAQEPITDRMLQYAWCHRVGYLCNDEEPAMDLILPLVRCPSATMAPMTTEQTHAVANATPSTDATVGKKRALDEEDAATEARTVKRLTRETRSTIRGSPPPTANVVPAVPTARRMPSRRDENKDDMDEGEGEQPAKAKGKKEEKEKAMAELEVARQRGFLPDRCPGLSAVAIQVKNYAGNIHLGEAYRYCRLQADRLRDTANVGEDVLSVLCMTGSGRVVSRSLPSTASPEGVLLFVEEPSSRGDCGTFVGLVVNGFDERLVGVDAKAQLEALSAQVSNTGIALDMYRQEHMDAALAQRYALVCQQQGARLPGHFDEAADAQPAVAADPRQTGNSKNTGGKKTKAVAAVTAPTTSAAPSTTTNPSEQPLTWTHRLVSVTSETVKRTLRVYSLGSVAR